MTKDEVLATLPNLKLEELAVVHSVSGHLLAGATAAQNLPGTPLAAIMFEALSGPLNVMQPYASVAGSKWGKQFDQKAANFALWLDQHFVGWDQTKVGQLAFLKMLFTMLSTDLKRRNLPRSLAMVVTNFEQMPRIIENAWPGYLDSGLGGLIIKNFQKSV